MSRRSAILLTLLVTACAPQAPLPTLPGTSNFMMGRDPIVVIGQSMVVFFRAPQANQPAAAARAIAELEWLADTTPRNPRWQTASGAGLSELEQARAEARNALGIPRNAPTQGVINGLWTAADAIDANHQTALAAALPVSLFPLGPAATVQRLSQPPLVPSVMQAAWALSSGPSPRGRR